MSLVLERDPAAGGPTPADLRAPDPEWFAALRAPHRSRVEAALAQLPRADATPREGLATALAADIARGFGTRRWQEGLRVAAIALETWNHHVHHGLPEGPDREVWLRGDAWRMRRVWDGLARRDGGLVSRVIDRALEPADTGDHPLPEAVIFLRAAVSAGVLCGDVPDAVHVALDRWATALGEAWEAALSSPWARLTRAEALGQAREALATLPDGAPTERLQELTERLPALDGDRRRFRVWLPRALPPAHPVLATTQTCALEAELGSVLGAGSRTMGRTVAWLQQQGGKRVRPRVVLAAASACGGDPADALRAAALLEWLHQASLVVDDVIDDAPLRRNVPTLHEATSVPFALGAAGWILGRLHVASRGLDPAVRAALADAAATLAEGQRAELAHTGDDQLPLSAYYRIIEAKTARLFACAAALGARAARAPAPVVKALGRYGREAGLAFQVVDDVLDYTGDEATLGKQPGTDLRARKITLPLLVLRDRLDPAGREALAAMLRTPNADFGLIREWMVRHDVAEDCLARARTHRDRALDALSALPSSAGRDELADLAERFVARSR